MTKRLMVTMAAAVCVLPALASGADVTKSGTYRADLMPYGEHVPGVQLPIVLGEGEEGPAGDCNVLIVAAADQVWADEVRNQLNSTGLLGPVDLFRRDQRNADAGAAPELRLGADVHGLPLRGSERDGERVGGLR
ncbi:MAG: hypothetical protein FLDDKLPJ_01514 [Phycisphaerae bacterium]|nr:hypothetical protein [Phycisphaerae bacterium]